MPDFDPDNPSPLPPDASDPPTIAPSSPNAPEPESDSPWPGVLKEAGGVVSDGLDIAELVPLLGTIYHGGMGIIDTIHAYGDGEQAKRDNQYASEWSPGGDLGKPTDDPSQYQTPGVQQEAAKDDQQLADQAKKNEAYWQKQSGDQYQKMEDDGADAQAQFFEAIPLIGTMYEIPSVLEKIGNKTNPRDPAFGTPRGPFGEKQEF